MPPSARQAEDVLISIGRLMEAAQTASSAIKTLNDESRENSATARAAAVAVGTIQGTLSDLDRIIRAGNGDSLVTQVKLICEEQRQIRGDVTELETSHKAFVVRIESLESDRSHWKGGRSLLTLLAAVIGFIITNFLTYHAAVNGK